MTDLLARHRRLVTWIVLGGGALLGVVAVVLATGLLPRAPVADATSPSPGASSNAASPEPSAEPSIRAIPAPSEPEFLGCVGNACPWPFAATVLVDDLRVRSAPGLSATPIGKVQTDDVVYLLGPPVQSDGQDWYNVQGRGNLVGWASAGPATGPYLDLRSHVPFNVPATIGGISAGDRGFLALVTEAHRAGDREVRSVLFSPDGSAWQRTTLRGGGTQDTFSAAWGPSGWIAIAGGALWSSRDGLSWAALPAANVPAGPGSLVGSSTGYILIANMGPGLQAYFSADGRAWQAVEGAQQSVVQAGVVPVPGGFLRWAVPEVGGTVFTTELAFSADGRAWADTGPPLPGSPGYLPLFAVSGKHLVAILTDQSTGAMSIWRSSLPEPALAWQRQSAAGAAMAATFPASLASDGSTLLLAGGDRTTGATLLWRSTDGSSWTAVPADTLFGGVVPPLAAGDAGFVGVGSAHTVAGANPVVWRSTDGLAWSSEHDPVMGMLDSTLVGSCPELPHTQLDWLAIPGPVAAECFGDTPITFDGWLTDSGGCGGYYTGVWEPAWLAPPYATYPIILTPFEAPNGACGSAAKHPTLTSIPAMQRWVTVTGHYDDPAATTCHWTPDAESGPVMIDRAWLIENCRETFVATKVVPVKP